MADQALTSNSAGSHSSLVTMFLAGYLAMQERRRRRRTMADLRALNDHALRDIGLQRFEISSAANPE